MPYARLQGRKKLQLCFFCLSWDFAAAWGWCLEEVAGVSRYCLPACLDCVRDKCVHRLLAALRDWFVADMCSFCILKQGRALHLSMHGGCKVCKSTFCAWCLVTHCSAGLSGK